MTYLWVRCFFDDACWRVVPIFYAFQSAYFHCVFSSLDVQVLDLVVGDVLVSTELWRIFFILVVFVLKMVAIFVVSFVG